MNSIVKFHLARWEGANSNTYPQIIDVSDGLIQLLIELAQELRRLGIQDIDGNLTYEEGEIC